MRNAVLICVRKTKFYLNINKRQECALTKGKKKKELKLLIFYTVNLNLNKKKFQLCSTNKYFPVQCLSKKTEV